MAPGGTEEMEEVGGCGAGVGLCEDDDCLENGE